MPAHPSHFLIVSGNNVEVILSKCKNQIIDHGNQRLN